jgi:cytochrome c
LYADPDIGTAPLTVRFSVLFNEDLPGPLSFAWDFGDGATDADSTPAHTYERSGEYTTTLTITATGRQTTRDVVIQVDPSSPSEAR